MSEQLTKLVVDCATGKQTIVPLTPAEIAQRDQDAARAEEERAVREAEAAAKAEAKESAIAKLVAMGLTEQEAQALLP